VISHFQKALKSLRTIKKGRERRERKGGGKKDRYSLEMATGEEKPFDFFNTVFINPYI